ncbi:MAG: NUDIX hydrolase [Cyclobacteriaceae bacterium]|nr:NUDIX hydrolase [Cyclobacteriaceae bacterium]
MTLEALADAIRKYMTQWPSEAETAQRYLDLLVHPDAFERTHLPGHITGSAFLVDPAFTHTLLVHHAKLNRWLQPGGHADGDQYVAGVARREANEETGVMQLDLLQPDIFDLDVHPIPERKDFPAHDHYDVRYLFRASMDEQVVVSEESFDVRWVPLAELERYNAEPSLLRLRAKLPR